MTNVRFETDSTNFQLLNAIPKQRQERANSSKIKNIQGVGGKCKCILYLMRLKSTSRLKGKFEMTFAFDSYIFPHFVQ